MGSQSRGSRGRGAVAHHTKPANGAGRRLVVIFTAGAAIDNGYIIKVSGGMEAEDFQTALTKGPLRAARLATAILSACPKRRKHFYLAGLTQKPKNGIPVAQQTFTTELGQRW